MTATASCNSSGKHTGGKKPYRWVLNQINMQNYVCEEKGVLNNAFCSLHEQKLFFTNILVFHVTKKVRKESIKVNKLPDLFIEVTNRIVRTI